MKDKYNQALGFFGVALIVIGCMSPLFFAHQEQNINREKFPVGSSVSIKGIDDCNCAVGHVSANRITVICTTHTGLTELNVEVDLLEHCDKIKY